MKMNICDVCYEKNKSCVEANYRGKYRTLGGSIFYDYCKKCMEWSKQFKDAKELTHAILEINGPIKIVGQVQELASVK